MTLSVLIQLHSDRPKNILPEKIRFTSSKNNHTSTLILTFLVPSWLKDSKLLLNQNHQIKLILIVKNDLNLISKDIKIIWVKGRPLYLQAIFLITAELESFKLTYFLKNLSQYE